MRRYRIPVYALLALTAIFVSVIAGSALLAEESSSDSSAELAFGPRCWDDSDCGGNTWCDRGRCKPIMNIIDDEE